MKLEKKEILFLAKFFAIFLILEWAINTIDLSAAQALIASTVAGFMGLKTVGNLIFVSDGAFEIVPSCTGLVSTGILAAIIFSMKKPELGKKIAIFAAGSLLLIALNYFRVMTVVLIGKLYGVQAGEITHIISWFSTAAFVIGLWYYFTKKITGVKNFSGFL